MRHGGSRCLTQPKQGAYELGKQENQKSCQASRAASIPCIERNAFAAARAFDANSYANFTDGRHRVSFDQVVEVMKRTGHDLPSLYKETSQGGLASNFED